MARYITILEVSQKQAYIFASNKVQDNIVNSAVIAHVLSPEYLSEKLKDVGYTDDKNMVYSGGGHTILEFEDRQKAVECAAKITEAVYREFEGLEIFVKTTEYNEAISPVDNLTNLTKELERKKSVRKSSFKHGSYGIEKISSDTLDIKAVKNSMEQEAKAAIKDREYKEAAREFTAMGYEPVYKFEDLGGNKNESNFIAVVHIDGNGMGKRVENLYHIAPSSDWTELKSKLRRFSEGIDEDFKAAYKEMAEEAGNILRNEAIHDKLSLKKNNFPIRRIITAGDDICFVAEGRIGIECARIFIEKLCQKKNKVDHEPYSACAGVAIVHQKYPFYRAYELAELLCSNAKRFGARISTEDNGASISSIDWHVEFGELKDTLNEIRQNYETTDGNRLELRPYIVHAPEKVMADPQYTLNLYDNFKRIIVTLQKNQNAYGIGKVKELRAALRSGELATTNYLEFNRMTDILIENKAGSVTKEDLMKLFTNSKHRNTAFVEASDGRKHSILFDSIELMDTFIAMEGEN